MRSIHSVIDTNYRKVLNIFKYLECIHCNELLYEFHDDDDGDGDDDDILCVDLLINQIDSQSCLYQSFALGVFLCQYSLLIMSLNSIKIYSQLRKK